MILGDRSHIFFYEGGGSAALGSIHPRTLPNRPDGTLAMEDIEAAIRPDNVHFPRTRLLVLENTHNRCSGTPLPLDYMKGVGDLARRHGLKVHIDGARIFNAAVALGVPAADLVADADSVSFCLSKGLAAPVGSLICGNADFIREARRNRKVVGGGMRQAGVLAAAGVAALTEMVDRLIDDHATARRLVRGLADVPGLSVRPGAVTTNIVYMDIEKEGMTAQALSGALEREGLRILPTGPFQLRAVTQYHVTAEDIDRALEKTRTVMGR